jgi:predicted nucleotide-binding protein
MTDQDSLLLPSGSDVVPPDPRNIFLHFLDHEYLLLTGLDQISSSDAANRVYRTAIVALMIAADSAYLPASSYFESNLARKLFGSLPRFREFGFLRLLGSGFGVHDFFERKQDQYSRDRQRYPRYFQPNEVRRLIREESIWHTRQRSATRDIGEEWTHSVLNQDPIWDRLARDHGMKSMAQVESDLLAVPERLGSDAFIEDFVSPLLGLGQVSQRDKARVNAFITRQYIHSYLAELSASALVDIPFGDSRAVLGPSGIHVSYKRVRHLWTMLGIDEVLLNAEEHDLLRLRVNELWFIFLRDFCWPYAQIDGTGRALGLSTEQLARISSIATDSSATIWDVLRLVEALAIGNQKGATKPMKKGTDLTQHRPLLFIVHGHDDATKLAVKNYLQNTLRLPEPIVLHEQPGHGRTLIEKFEDDAGEAGGAVVLLTPDDHYVDKGSDEELRLARQNVIFELGFFLGTFGRRSGKVLLLYKKPLDIPSDISGISYIDISNGVEAAGESIRLELQ